MQIKFSVTSVLKTYSKNMRIMHASRLRSFYSINFQIKQIPATNNIFSEINNPFSIKLYCLWTNRMRFLKKKNFFQFEILLAQASKQKNLLCLEKYFKILNDVIIGTEGTKLLESFKIVQSGQNHSVKTWVFDDTRGISRYRKLSLILILHMK